MNKLDVVVFGATGFTGGLVAEWLANNHLHRKIGLAGRNEEKLRAVRSSLARLDPSINEWPLLIADAANEEQLLALAHQTKVVISTVGPFFKYGQPLVAACVKAGTHYTDITGEPHFIAKMIERHHQQAQDTGSRIVHASGFDSLPSDLGTLFLQKTAIERYGKPVPHVRLIVEKVRGSFSGGTIHTIIDSVESARKNKEIRRIMAKPYSLCSERGEPIRSQHTPEFDHTTARWTAPFIMAAANEKVVRRSHELLGYPWGKHFTYDEAMDTGPGKRGHLRAWTIASGLGLSMGVFAVGPLRSLSKRFLPSPGDGPTYEQRMAGFFRMMLYGYTEGHLVKVRVHGQFDPGYGGTSGMIAETAIALADTEGPGGILTPASALGEELITRLSKKHLRFEAVL